MSEVEAPEITDGRLLRGAQARDTIARRAVDIASLDGLDGLSLGKLATDLGLSKSGIQTLFGTKENLQLAAIDSARRQFVDAVVRPATIVPRGSTRLRELIEHWIVYAETPLFPGGCFRAANMATFDSKLGPVRDALGRDRREWLQVLQGELDVAVETGEIADVDTRFAAFQIDALLVAVNSALRFGDSDAVSMLRRRIDELLTPPRN